MTARPSPTDRCTDRARGLLREADRLADARGEPAAAKHLLAAATGGGGVSQHVLKGDFGLSRADALAASLNVGAGVAVSAVLGQAQQECKPLGHGYVGTEHLLLALAAVAPEEFEGLGLDPGAVRRAVYDVLGHDLPGDAD